MELSVFYLRAGIYIACLLLSFFAMSSLNFEKWIKANHIWQAQLLYALCVMALAYLSAQFILAFLFRL